MSLYQFTLTIDEIIVRDVTERKIIRNTGPNEGDEVSFTTFYGGSNDPELSQEKRPANEDYIRLKKGDVRQNIEVLSTTIDLDDNESAFASVNISDDDDINWINFLEGLGGLGKAIFNGVRGILASDFTAIVQAIVEAVQGSIKIADSINEQGAETIAIMNLGIQVKDGRPTFEWRGAFDQTNNVQTSISSRLLEENSVWFLSLGKRSDYRIKISAQFDAATRQAYTTSSLEGSSQSKLLLYGANPIDGTGNELDNVIIGNHTNNYLQGLAGQDLLNGGDGDDVLDGGWGNDTMFGGLGKDSYLVDSSNDVITEYINEGIDIVNSLIAYVLGENLENLMLIGNEAVNGTGNSLNNIITGNSGNNTLSGLAGDDILIGGGGDDLFFGEIGNDQIDGGDGIDTSNYHDDPNSITINLEQNTVTDGFGNIDLLNNIENIIGSQFSDRIIGNNQDNLLFGGLGNDVIEARGGDDTIYGETGNNTLLGEAGNDKLIGDIGADLLDGGEGNDTASYSTSALGVIINLEGGTAQDGFGNTDRLQNIENVIGSAFADQIVGDRNINTIYAGDGDDWVEGRGGNDTLLGEAGDDTLLGEDGDDLLIGGIGADSLNGGKGNDTASYSTSALGVITNLTTGRGATGDARGDVYESIENLEGSQWGDRLIGNNTDNSLSGLDGDDFIDGRSGDDQLFGHAGDDDLQGGNGNDTLDGGNGHDFLYGSEGNDQLLGGQQDDYLEGGTGDDTLNGNEGQDWLEAGAGADQLYGDTGDDGLFGGDGADRLQGGDGNDSLNGEAGDDGLTGGSGNDTLTGGGWNDAFLVIQGNGIDTITDLGGIGRGSNPSQSMMAEVDVIKFEGNGLIAQNMLLTQNGTDLEITFAGVANTTVILQNFALEHLDNLHRATGLEVNSGNILFDGQTDIQDSFDVFNAEWQRDQILNRNSVTFLNDLDNAIKGFHGSQDVINGQGGNDILSGLSGNDLLRGGTGDDTLLGGAGNDELIGGEGDDILAGGSGTLNALSGDAGSDIFALASNGFSQVRDFEPGTDRIGLWENLTFDQLILEQGTGVDSSSTWIKLATDNRNLMLLNNVQVSVLTPAMFLSTSVDQSALLI